HCHQGFARILTSHTAGQRHDDHTHEMPIGGIVADDHSGSGLADFATYRRIEFDPPDLTALHDRPFSPAEEKGHPPDRPPDHCTTPEPRARAPRPPPWLDSRYPANRPGHAA